MDVSWYSPCKKSAHRRVLSERLDSSFSCCNQTLRAAMDDLKRRYEERGKLLKMSESLRAQLVNENNALKEENRRLKYMLTPSPFESRFSLTVKGTLLPEKKSASRLVSSESLPRKRSRREAYQNLGVEPESRVKRLRSSTSRESSTSNHSVQSGSTPTSSRACSPMVQCASPGLVPKPEPQEVSLSMTTPASENLKKQDARPVDAQHSNFYPVPLSVGQASSPNFGNKINANLIGLESTDLIRTMLLPTFGIKAKYPYNTECNAQIIRTLKQLLNEAGVYTTQFKWSILALILYKHRLRWVGWPVEINHSPQMKKRPPGIPGSMRAHELDVMKAALARRLFSKNGDGLSLVEWNDDENEEDFPPLFITTDGGRHSLRETVVELLESGRTAIFRARDSRESSAQKGSEKSESE